MKRIFSLVFLLMLVPVVVFGQTRQELAVRLADIFSLQADTRGLYYYNDWLKIDSALRGKVGASAESGLFQPDRGEYRANGVVGQEEYKLATNGLDEFIFLSTKYDKAMGTVGESGNVVVDNGEVISIDGNVAFLSSRGLVKCDELKRGQKVNLCRDKAGKVYIVWEQKQSDYEVVGVRQGELYLWDLYEKEMIFKKAQSLKYGMWTSLGGRYDTLNILEQAKVYSEGRQVWRGEINANWLDRRANYVVGKNSADGSLRILHIEFE